ncbi:SulP family inorganic anion transporter [Thiomicrospira microaerophila]|uniref:SulP family inorganic anion transporter n=1 Tax=Thiomicrospira microaerophila TaxID=406020 RepID=UPI00200D6225|nr:SulP family inorganic anion transporter [Thiomicrospira microaerophila]UQB42447.1 SulP family inorganic anion transporter [Thiomicrospira microaerophila]
MATTELEQKSAQAADTCEGKSCAAFQKKYVMRDVQAGVITAAMAIPLSIGIAIMSEYPIQVGLATVAFASFIGWMFAWFRPGNFIGAPGIAAGLAPILAMGVSMFGISNMAFIIFLTAAFQAIIWKFNWQRYILQLVPTYLVEGLLAGIGLKIVLAFLLFTYEVPIDVENIDSFFSTERWIVIGLSVFGAALFLILFKMFKDRQPAVPYFALIVYGIVASLVLPVSMLHVEDAELALALPIPDFDSVSLWAYAIGFALMLAIIDVIEQVMSNAAIEKIDPLKRKCNSNNSLLSIWVSNMGSSFFGGMTNLDGLAKSSTNRLAGAYTKLSVLVIALVITFFVINIQYLDFLPKFALGIIMIFVGIKMILGLMHVAHFGRYALLLAILCGLLVYWVGIFEGLLIALAVHAFINFVIFKERDNIGTNDMVKNYMNKFKEEDGLN